MLDINIIRNPKTVKGLAREIINVCDGYWSRKIKEDEAREYIRYWSKYESIKLFKGDKLNSTVTKIIGKRRTELVNTWLVGTQISI
ncbi:TIGR04540 family protein (plasmid) [Clostridium tyrobutyricum]|uniref:TIGR04540 family protein n=1 Tax=Clostridium tyrobutyricum TaxID=1519 RepID=UPI0039F6E861